MQQRRRMVIVMVAVLVAATVVFFWQIGSRRLSPETARRLIGEANQTLAWLENQQLLQAAAGLDALATVLPNDPFVVRNAAVLALVQLTADPWDATAKAAALQRLATLADREGKSSAFHWLVATAALASDDNQLAVDELATLAEQHSSDPAAHYGLWLATRKNARGGVTLAPLERACQLAPENIWLAVEWLRAAATQLHAAEPASDPNGEVSVEAFAARTASLKAIEKNVTRSTRVELAPLIADCRSALAQGESKAAAQLMRKIANVSIAYAATDRREVERHPLEFLIESLAPGVVAAADRKTETKPPAIPVSFSPLSTVDWPGTAGGPLGLLLEDFDTDGRLDVVAWSTTRLLFWRGSATGWTTQETAELPTGTRGLLALDIDLDFDESRQVRSPSNAVADAIGSCLAADLDLISFGEQGCMAWENRIVKDGRRSFVPSELALPEENGPVVAASAADFDGDGRIDLVLATDEGLRLWFNYGSRGFVDRTPATMAVGTDITITSLLPVDWDRDIDVDLLVGTSQGVLLLENLRHGSFRQRGLIESPQSVVDVEAVDTDANAVWDIVTAGVDGTMLYHFGASPGDQPNVMPIADVPCNGLALLDYDNDGWLDLACHNTDGLRLARGLSGRFESLSEPVNPLAVTAVDSGDVDGDGDLDLALATPAGLGFLENNGGNANHWLAVNLVAQQIKAAETAPSGRVNAHGLGSLLELRAGGMYQPRTVRRPTTHFGLGTRREVDSLRVLWLNGVPQNLVAPATDLLICEQQVLLGSCPYVYGWDGQRHVFITDLLWAAPLGLQWTEGNPLPARPQEWIKLPGDKLAIRDGQYQLQITEELWEAAYFDEVRLLAVDHPPDVSVYSNEKVGPPAQAAFGIHTVRQPLLPRRACDHEGRDILPQLAQADGIYPPIDEGKIAQGRVRRHAIELELGEPVDTKQLTLFLTGWTYPTTVALNLALSRDPATGLPDPPALFVPEGDGWKCVLPAMGFPGGKTKTIAVDLAGLIVPEDPRVRIETSMEIHWDAVFYTSGESPAELKLTELPLQSADLHYRGFSRVDRDDSDGPEQFNYDQVTAMPKWPPLAGGFTRFGDVQDLLAATDDRLLVMAAGDELTLRFDAMPCPPGWQRDFLLMSVGWDKDANLATLAGQSSEPLPFGAGRKEPPGPDEAPPATDWYRDYLLRYQTRRQSAGFWSQFRRGDLPAVSAASP